MILPCDCKHKFQDERYGPGMSARSAPASDAGLREALERCAAIAHEEHSIRARVYTDAEPLQAGLALIERIARAALDAQAGEQG